MKYSLFILAFYFLSPTFAQVNFHKCGTTSYNKHIAKNFPSNNKGKKRGQSSNWVEVYDESPVDSIITIPVVVHILTPNISAPENITKWQVYSQIIALNEDFSRDIGPEDYGLEFPPFWADVYSGDTRIRFCLARLDPNGKPTIGITRTMTEVEAFDPYMDDIKFDQMGGKDAWPRREYLNIWVGRLSDDAGFAGYALYPGGPAERDGIVVDYRYFGTVGTVSPPQNRGRTAVHEVGHWLNLMHTWGPEDAFDDGVQMECNLDDEVDDTPPQEAPNFACGAAAYTFSCDGSRDMLSNFMNYSPDPCNNFFTKGQARRMRANFLPGEYRYMLQFSTKGCREVQMKTQE